MYFNIRYVRVVIERADWKNCIAVCRLFGSVRHNTFSLLKDYFVGQCFSTAGPRPDTVPWHQLYRAARDYTGICHFSFLRNFMNKYFIVEIF